MIFHENRLPADDSHEISCLICYFLKSSKIWNCRLLQIIGLTGKQDNTGEVGTTVNRRQSSSYSRDIML